MIIGQLESLRSYVARFNREALLIYEADDKVLVIAFTNGLCFGEFLFSIYKNDPKTMADMLYKATKYMNAEDAMIAQEGKGKKRDSQDAGRPYERRKSAWTNEKREDKRSRSPVG